MRTIGLIIFVLCMSACSDFIEESISNEKVELFSPGINAESAVYDIRFLWKEIPNVDYYRLQIAAPDFNRVNLFYADTLINGTAFKISLDPGLYTWRVQGVNGSSETAFTQRSFTIYESDFSKQTVLLDRPSTDYLSNGQELTLAWHPLFRSTNYRLQVTTDNFDNTETLVFDGLLTEQTYHLKDLEEEQYQWRVSGLYEDQESRWSEVREFTIDRTPPDKPVLVAPQNNQLVQLPVDLMWQGTGAESYELFIYKADSVTLYNSTYPIKLRETHHTFEGGSTSGRVLWRVRAYDKAGNVSAFSGYRSMITPN